MSECPYKDNCPYLGDASAEEILAEKKRLERCLTYVSGNRKGAKDGNGGSGKKEQNAEFSVKDHS